MKTWVGLYFCTGISGVAPYKTGPALVALLNACPTGDQEFVVLTQPGRQHSLVEIDHEIFSTVILPPPLIQEGQVVSFCQKNMHNTG